MEAVMEYVQLGDWMSGGCEADALPEQDIRWIMFMECYKLLCEKRFIYVKGAVYTSHVMPRILYGSEAWCLRERKVGILQRTERSMVSTVCGVQLKDRKR